MSDLLPVKRRLPRTTALCSSESWSDSSTRAAIAKPDTSATLHFHHSVLFLFQVVDKLTEVLPRAPSLPPLLFTTPLSFLNSFLSFPLLSPSHSPFLWLCFFCLPFSRALTILSKSN